MTGMCEGELPFKYLGVPLSAQKLNVLQYQPLIQKILSKLDNWAAKLLSYAGRLQLIKSVIGGIQLYWCQVFLIPHKVLKVIQSACRTFLWTGKTALFKRALVAWEKVVLPKYACGLGIGNLKCWNQAAICKLLWNVQHMKNRTWIQWIHGYYIKGRDLFEVAIPQQCSWIVRKIFGAREYIQRLQNGKELIQGHSFSIRRLYNDLIGCVEKVPWAKMMCQNSAPVKYLFITWLLLHEKLATCSYLRRIGISIDPMCCICERNEEILDHLFFECEFSRGVWKRMADWCGVQRTVERWELEKIFLISRCTNNNKQQRLYRCMFAVVSYHLWRERNARRLQGRRTTEEMIVRQCQIMMSVCKCRDKKLRLLNF